MQEATHKPLEKQSLGESKGQSVQEVRDSSRPLIAILEKYFSPHKREERTNSIKRTHNGPINIRMMLPHQICDFINFVSHPRVYDAGVHPVGGSEGIIPGELGGTN